MSGCKVRVRAIRGTGVKRAVLAIDPGSEKSAWVVYDGERPYAWGKDSNEALRFFLKQIWAVKLRPESPPPGFKLLTPIPDLVAIEYVYRRGMDLMQQAVDTMFEAGRIVEAWGGEWTPIDRKDVKLHLCGSARAKDSNIRAALIDRFGGKEKAIGGVKCRSCGGKGWKGRGRPPCEACHCYDQTGSLGCGRQTHKGPLHGIAADCWSALAIAVTWWDT